MTNIRSKQARRLNGCAKENDFSNSGIRVALRPQKIGALFPKAIQALRTKNKHHVKLVDSPT